MLQQFTITTETWTITITSISWHTETHVQQSHHQNKLHSTLSHKQVRKKPNTRLTFAWINLDVGQHLFGTGMAVGLQGEI